MRAIKNSSGFTVIEVVVAVVIAGALLLSITTLVNSLNVINDRARDLTIANALAENKMESLRSISFIGLVDGTTDFTSDLPESLTGAKSASYTICTADACSGDNPGIGRKRIDMTITFQDRGVTRTLNYRTIVGELGVGQY
ncbi:MAG: prepilin-type N-terminal cleavage/methylation domain-containing protein [Candidatus Saccharimonadales bacterium]|nr:prepilin-type N-terminal cleavage/methylation domain-containing protein [Candidatus Saccharimonadales bacterium]